MHQYGSERHGWDEGPLDDPATDESLVDSDTERRRDYGIALNRFIHDQPLRERNADGSRRPCDTSAAWTDVAARLDIMALEAGLDAGTLGVRLPVRDEPIGPHTQLQESSWWPDELVAAFPAPRPLDVHRFAGGTDDRSGYYGHVRPTVTAGMFETAYLIAEAGADRTTILAVLACALGLERDVALDVKVFRRDRESGISDIGSLAERYLADRHLLLDRGRFRRKWLPSDVDETRLEHLLRSEDPTGPIAADDESTLRWMATELSQRLEGQHAVRFVYPEGGCRRE